MSKRQVSLRAYAELNDFLPPVLRTTTLSLQVEGGTTVKDLIESVGVPHTEVDLIVMNGESVGFGQQVAEGDRVAVYPVFEAFDITPILRVRPAPLRGKPQFVLDTHLGRLARHLRLLGFDAYYVNDARDEELARISVEQHRVLLTRDVGLLKRTLVTHGHFVRSTSPMEQVVEVVKRFDLLGEASPFSRCLACNGRLEDVTKSIVSDRVPPFVRRHFQHFRSCPSCGRLYWRGSHYDRLVGLVAEIERRAVEVGLETRQGTRGDDWEVR